jgi:hypothetical protein
MLKSPMLGFIGLLAALGLLTALAPIEKTLGANARVIYLHGAWVWVAMVAFLAAAIIGLAALVARREHLNLWSQAIGRTGLFFWLTFLPMSLYVMQANWNGLFLDEPRFRIPLNLAIVGLLLQVGLSFFPVRWTSLANLVYGAALILVMGGVQTVLHPESPIINSEARSIQVFFVILLVGLVVAAWLLAWAWYQWELSRRQALV